MSCKEFIPLEVCRGRSFSKHISIDLGNGDIDLTGYIFSAFIKKTAVDVKIEEFEFILSGDKKSIEMRLTDAKTKQLVAGKYQYDVKEIRPDGTIETLFTGVLTVKESITL